MNLPDETAAVQQIFLDETAAWQKDFWTYLDN